MNNTNKHLQLLYFCLISHKNKAYKDMINFLRERMGVGKHSLQGVRLFRSFENNSHSNIYIRNPLSDTKYFMLDKI